MRSKSTGYIKYFLAVTALVYTGLGNAAVFDFSCIPSANPVQSCDQAESLLSLDVTDSGGGDTLFQFFVGGDAAPDTLPGDNATVKRIFFDDTNALLNFGEDDFAFFFDFEVGGDDRRLFFSDPESGGQLPGGSSLTPQFDSTFNINSQNSGDDRFGIDNDQWLEITFSNTNFGTIFNALTFGSLNIGLHVGSLYGDGICINPDEINCKSESLVTNLTVVPVPAAFWLFGTALIGFFGFSRKTTT